MSKFLRKVASAFVVLDEEPGAAQPSTPAAGLEEIAQDASALLSQLEPGRDGPQAGAMASGDEGGDNSLLDRTAEDVFREQNVVDTPNSALRLIKVIAGIAMFPKDQQLALVRAMDAADDTWSEPEVVADARRRQAILREHLAVVSRERSERSQALDRQIAEARQNGDAVLSELDRRIAELHARRAQEAEATAATVAQLEQQQRDLEARELRARQGTAQVIQALAGLLMFLGVQPSAESK